MSGKKVKLIIFLAIPVFILTGFCFWLRVIDDNLGVKSKVIIPIDYNQELFLRAISRFPLNNEVSSIFISGLVAPHHDIASDYTAELFQKVGGHRNIKRVIIVGPNHINSGASDVISGDFLYRYLGEEVEFDKELINQLVEDRVVILDDSRLSTEHSISNLIPFVNYYFKDAKVVPLILGAGMSLEQSKKLGEYLAPHLDKQTIIIASVDFSHYLNTEKANNNDIVTREAFLNRDYNKLFSLDSDYLDSPATLVTVLSAVSISGADKIEVLRQVNLAEAIGASSVTDSTSYFTTLLYR